MKKLLTSFFLFLVVGSFAQWQVLGQRKFSPGNVQSLNLEVNNTGVPYVAFQDMANGGKASVMKYNGANWVYVGAPQITAAAANHLHFAISNSDTLYVAYSNGTDSVVYVQKFNGTNWQQVGTSVMKSIYADVALDKNGIPHVAIVTGKDAYGGPDTVYVKKMSGSNWVNVGGTLAVVPASVPEIEIDTAGKIYLAVSSRSLSYGTLFSIYNNSSWQPSGGLPYREYVSLKSNHKDKVVIANASANYPSGSAPPYLVDFKTTSVLYALQNPWDHSFDAAVDTSGYSFYLFGTPPPYSPSTCGSNCTGMNYVLAGISTAPLMTNFGTTGPCKIAIDNSNGSSRGTGYIAFVDTGSSPNLTVISNTNPSSAGVHEIANSSQNISVYPNPTNKSVRIESIREIGEITVFNLLGEIIFRDNISDLKTQLDLSKLPAGIYYLKTKEGTAKIVKE